MYTIIASDGQQYGPSDFATVQQWIQAGQANAQTMVYKEGTADWVPLSTLPEFAGILGGAPGAPATPAAPGVSVAPGMPMAGGAAPTTGIPKVLGILNIVFGGGGVLCAPCVMMGMLALAAAMAGGEGLADIADKAGATGADDVSTRFGWMKWYFIFMGVIFTVTASLMLAGGIGLVKYRNWGRKLSITVAILTCVMAVADVATTYAVIKPAVEKMNLGGAHDVGGVSFLIGKLLQVAYPIVLLVLLNKPNVKQSMT